jgi:CheY-like chemotaxis protein
VLAPKSLRILFVDADSEVIEVVSRILTKLGHVVTSQSTSCAALRIFSEQPDGFDIAILEVSMDLLTGLELAHRFRNIRPGFPLILHVADVSSCTTLYAEKAGMFFCRKPATRSEMETVIRKACAASVPAPTAGEDEYA